MTSDLVGQLFEGFFSRTQNQQGQNAAGNEPQGDMNGFLRDGIGHAGVGQPCAGGTKNQGQHGVKRHFEGARGARICLP